MFQSSVSGENWVVWFDNSGSDLRCRVDRKFQFRFFTVVNRESLHQKRGETGTGTTTERVENEESLKTGTLVSQFSDAVQDEIDNFFTDGIVTTGIVIGGIFFTRNELFGVEKLSVCTGSDLRIFY